MPKPYLNLAETVGIFSQAYEDLDRKISPSVLIKTMFAILDAMPDIVTTSELDRTSRISMERRNAFSAFSKLGFVERKEKPSRRGPAALGAVGTEKLVELGDGFNRLYLTSIVQNMAAVTEPRSVVERSMRALASIHDIDAEAPLQEIASVVKERTGMHSLTVTHCALSAFARGFNLTLVDQTETYIRDLIQGRESLPS